MDFTLDKKHEMARSLFREFAENEVKPLAQETDETEQFPAETVKKMAKYGFMGIPVPKEYGGQGCDPLTYVMCVEELSKVCAKNRNRNMSDHLLQARNLVLSH
jgi:butyryl-CoA dehydrogenase